MENRSGIFLLNEKLEELSQLVHQLNNSPGQVYRIDVDLALEKLRNIYDSLSKLDVQSAVSMPQANEGIVIEKVIMKEEIVQETPDAVRHEEVPQIDLTIIPEDFEVEEAPSTDKKIKEEPPTLSDLFSTAANQNKSHVKKIIVEKMAEEKPVEILADQFGKKRISGLNQAIGINEKFFFINELFDGNMKEYKTAIDTLDKFENFAKAAEFLDTIVIKNSWDKSSEAYTMLLDFVERRFS
jgi:hypothetical protein